MDNQYQFPNQPHQQPSYFQGQRPPKPNNHLAWAILSTIFCCLPLGIVSIVYSSKVDGLYNAGEILRVLMMLHPRPLAMPCGALLLGLSAFYVAFVSVAFSH